MCELIKYARRVMQGRNSNQVITSWCRSKLRKPWTQVSSEWEGIELTCEDSDYGLGEGAGCDIHPYMYEPELPPLPAEGEEEEEVGGRGAEEPPPAQTQGAEAAFPVDIGRLQNTEW